VTHIIHSAWPVNFNYTLASFETAISFVRELAGLAASSKQTPTIVFMSSVATLARAPAFDWVEEAPIEGLEVSVGSGYGESKRVAEEVGIVPSCVRHPSYVLTIGCVYLTDSQRGC
jgi:nucleoside-diphosphate-sugar epimerase